MNQSFRKILSLILCLVMALSLFPVSAFADAELEETTGEVMESAAEPAPEPVKKPVAPGTAGELKLYDTDPRDAAMIMAIVANATGKNLNELRFKSIKEVK